MQRIALSSAYRVDYTRLRKRRRELEVQLNHLAAAIGCERTLLWRVEHGKGDLRVHQLAAASRALSTPMLKLFEVVEE